QEFASTKAEGADAVILRDLTDILLADVDQALRLAGRSTRSDDEKPKKDKAEKAVTAALKESIDNGTLQISILDKVTKIKTELKKDLEEIRIYEEAIAKFYTLVMDLRRTIAS